MAKMAYLFINFQAGLKIGILSEYTWPVPYFTLSEDNLKQFFNG